MTENRYPKSKITECYKYIEDFEKDLKCMIDISNKIELWNKRGINLNDCTLPLNNQIELWNKTMNILINDFKNNIETIKKFDERIENGNNIDNIVIPDKPIIEKWSYLFNIYEKLFTNLNEDINILKNALNDLNNYSKIGVNLGDVNTLVNNQITNIENGINNSLNGLDNIILKIQDESKKIINDDEELVNNTNNLLNIDYLALNAKYNFSELSSILYFNATENNNINWNPEEDGKNIIKNMTQVYFDKKSVNYDEEVGEKMLITNSEKPFKYLYYGFSKDDMNCININQNYFVQYAEQHGYQYNITIYHDTPTVHGSHLTDQYKEMFEKYGKEYKGLSTTTDKILIVYSTDLINDFSNITFRG